MCFFPSMSAPAPVQAPAAVPEPVKPAEVKQAAQQGETGAFGSTIKQGETNAFGSSSTARKSMAGGMASSTLLTGPTGIERNQLNLRKATLLGNTSLLGQ